MDGLGFGGKIRTQVVDKFLKETGRSILKGNVESRLAAHPSVPIPSILPMLTASQINTFGRKRLREERVGERVGGNPDELK